LFEPLADYDWKKTDVILPNRLFTNDDPVEEGITGTGILDVFDRYNFTVNEAEPLEKEVAIDPEMLGKVFENLIEENRRKGLGAFYTPREIVHYMCQESLINYLETAVSAVPRADIETFVRLGEQISHYEAVEAEYKIKMPKSIQKSAKALDEALRTITVCDPAVGSGAFPVGMMTEIVRARAALTPYFPSPDPSNPSDVPDAVARTPYHFKRHAIQNCLYGVDIDSSAVDIAKLRLWLSLVVDEEDVKQVKPLPNLDYKIVVGNSLIELLASAGLHASTDAVRTDLVNRLKTAKAQMFDLTASHEKRAKRHEVDCLFQELFRHDKDKQIQGIRQRLANIRGQGQLFQEGSRKQQAVERELEFSIGEIEKIRVPKPSEHFEWHIHFSDVFHAKRGFDVVIANPPYVSAMEYSTTHSKAERALLGERYESASGAYDIYVLFMEQGMRLLRDHGILTYINPNKYLSAKYAEALRTFILQNGSLKLLLDVSGIVVFDQAAVYPVVSLIAKQIQATGNVRLVLPRVRQTADYDPRSFFEASVALSALRSLPEFIWGFLLSPNVDLLLKLTRGALTLKDVADINASTTAGEAEEYGATFRNSADKSALKVVNTGTIERFICLWGKSALTHGGQKFLTPYLPLDRSIVNERRSALYRSPKLIFAKMARTCEAFFDERGEYASVNTNCVYKPAEGVSLGFLAGYCNSRLFMFFYEQYFGSLRMSGGYFQFQAPQLRVIPFRKPDKKSDETLQALVSNIMAAKRRNPAADTDAQERDIDKIVYRLFDLTPAEIAQIEGALANTRRAGDGQNEADHEEAGA